MPDPRYMIKSLSVLMLLVPSLCARAQSARIGLFMDAVLGAGPRTQQAGTVWFRPESRLYGRVSGGLTTPLRARVSAVVTIARARAGSGCRCVDVRSRRRDQPARVRGRVSNRP